MLMITTDDVVVPSSSAEPQLLKIKDATYALAQFIALGVGVIVGRCGRASPASVLAPSSLSIVGQNWVVVPARPVVVELTFKITKTCIITFSISPTLGLVDKPTLLDVDSGLADWSCFCACDDVSKVAWVGPRSLGCRFALVVSASKRAGYRRWSVIDTKGKVAEMSLTDYWPLFCGMCISRRWAAAIRNRWNVTMTLWNFDDIENGNVTKVEEIALPWSVHRRAFDDHNLLVLTRIGGRVLTVDLKATLAQNRLIKSPQTYMSHLAEKEFCHGLVCWKGLTYALVSSVDVASLLCMNTGQRTPLPQGAGVPIGGPYFEVACTKSGYNVREVYSVVEPTKVSHSHLEDQSTLYFGHEMAVRETEGSYIEFSDSVSGFVVFKMEHATYARSQFIALGAAVVVGRCARGGDDNSCCCSRAPVSALTPSLLCLIGREWVVFAAKRLAIDLTAGGGTAAHHELITLSVSLTLGLVDAHRVLADIGGTVENWGFRGWVGGSASGSDSADERFALVVSRRVGAGACQVGVIDTARLEAPAEVEAVIKNWWNGTMSLWNLAGIESGIVTKAENMSLPWSVDRVAFDPDDGSLVVVVSARGFYSAMIIDLDATLVEKRVVGRPISIYCASMDESIQGVVCWKGMHHVLFSGYPNRAGMLCLETRQKTSLGSGNAHPIGGPYFAVTRPSSEGSTPTKYCIEVFSILEPTKVLCVHKYVEDGGVFIRKEVVVRDTGARYEHHRPGDIEIIDAVSGFVVCRVVNREWFVDEVT
ncbi:hypothetical protein Pelo_15296 [Pelomyxa schiedti]|nr:hypothetical protein Pelo_15296 [Pelomyxa schiedti]